MLCYVMLCWVLVHACIQLPVIVTFCSFFKGFDFVSSECVSLTSINGSCWAVNESPPVIDHRLAINLGPLMPSSDKR
ncbi:hypothetical protein DER46DRAFT_254602 [Fusarium sp. MPI-SDFR-AT-0072]|nr:hypothetical protein DER46DRAFT_254602 [Fusarium sp. MPI-SDFR-AT-0072]